MADDKPSTTIAENERAIAFMHINPVTPGHALVHTDEHGISHDEHVLTEGLT